MSFVKEKEKLKIRKMTLEDLNRVLEIHCLSFTDCWSVSTFEAELKSNQFAHYYVLEKNNCIVGYIGIWFVINQAEITSFAIHPDYRRNSYGKRLFFYAMKQAMLFNMETLSLEVRISNLPAQHLYRKFGLLPIRIRKKYYKDNNEDAIVMGVNLR